MTGLEGKDPAAMSAALRASALSVTPGQIGFVPSAPGQDVFGVLMETGYEQGVFTLACFFDGATSLYFSKGGGVIGCGEHEKVSTAAKALISLANTCALHLPPATDFPLPAMGMVRFYLRAPAATVTHEAREKDLGEKRDSLWSLFYAGHLVITAIRELGLM
jgi:hypothetical protein